MSADADIWSAFARSFGMLFMVLALLLLIFYLLKRFLAARTGNTTKDLIKVLTVHHLSPKEKLILVNVMDETILIGVTPNQISTLKVMDKSVDVSSVSKADLSQEAHSGFQDLLKRTLSRSTPVPRPKEPLENISHGDRGQDA